MLSALGTSTKHLFIVGFGGCREAGNMVGISLWSGWLGSMELPANVHGEKPVSLLSSVSSSKIIWELYPIPGGWVQKL